MMTDMQIETSYWDNAAGDPDVENRYMSNLPVDVCINAILPFLKPYSVLEIGCGIGRLTEAIASKRPDWQVHGIDISTKLLDLTPASNVKYRVSNGRTIPYADESFDSVYSMVVFQHIPDSAKENYIKEAARVLKPGGVFRVQAVEGLHHSDIDHNVTLTDMQEWFQSAGLTAEFQRGLIFNNWVWFTATKEGA